MLSPPTASLLTALQAVLVLCAIIAIGRWNRTPTRIRVGHRHCCRAAGRRPSPASSPSSSSASCGLFHEPGTVHDERAYLLQAEIFARWHWTAPAPPLASFFEQMHVFIEPAVFAKYPPAHALTLAPGIWLGRPDSCRR